MRSLRNALTSWLLYSEGRGGLPKDEREAARLYKLAADQGNATAQVNLGEMYANEPPLYEAAWVSRNAAKASAILECPNGTVALQLNRQARTIGQAFGLAFGELFQLDRDVEFTHWIFLRLDRHEPLVY